MRFALTVSLAALVHAQTNVAFETASVKEVANPSTCDGSMIQPMPGAGLRAVCVSVRSLITWAYRIQDYQLSGGPSWVESTSWDIMAKSAAAQSHEVINFEDLSEAHRNVMLDDVRSRLRALLADRFRLTLRSTMKEQTVYSLVIGKNGPRMKEADRSGMIRRAKTQILGTGTTMTLLCQYLGIALGRPVTDRTGLTAYYAFELNWTPEGGDTDGPSLITAVQEQLGLRLEASKGQIESLTIERIEKASEN